MFYWSPRARKTWTYAETCSRQDASLKATIVNVEAYAMENTFQSLAQGVVKKETKI
jgi:hypothetical protein